MRRWISRSRRGGSGAPARGASRWTLRVAAIVGLVLLGGAAPAPTNIERASASSLQDAISRGPARVDLPRPANVTTAQIAPEIVVRLTSPQNGQRLRGRVEITGYAADTRSPDGSGLNERDIQIFINDSADPWNLFDYALAGRDSPDAAASLGPRFNRVGFWDSWDTCTFPEGPYKLVVWVSSQVSLGAVNVATADVYVEACAPGTMVSQTEFDAEPGGVYTMELSGPQTRSFAFDPIYADFAAGIDARCPTAGVSCFYGLQFRELPGPGTTRTNSYYRFSVDPGDGTFTLGYSPPGDDPIITIIPWTQSPSIQRGAATNRVAVIVQGDWLRLFVNGRQVGEARDERRPWGQIGWAAETEASGRTVQVQFDNFQVSTPGPAERLSPIFPGADNVAGTPPAAPAGPAQGGPAAPPPVGPTTGRVLLSDDFRDANSGWPRQSSDPTARRVGYEGGEYVVTKLPGSDGAPFVTRSERFGDFLAEIDARLLPPTDDAFLFLDFRRQEDGSHYSLVADPNDSTFLFRRNTPQGGTNLIPWTNAPAIRGGSAPNRLGVRARGAEITLFVNGQEVGRVQDGTYREGTLAFGVGSLADGLADGRFSNLVVSSLD